MRLINYRDILYSFYSPLKDLNRGEPRQQFIKDNIPVNTVGVEVGVAGGKHASYLYEFAKPKHLTLIDHWDSQDLKYYYFGTKEKTTTQYEKVLEWSAGKNITVTKADSVQGSTTLDDESKDWIYIDGDHTYEGVMRDLKAYWPKLKKGGILMGDDLSIFDQKKKFGVDKALMEFFPDDTPLYLEVQNIDHSRRDDNGKPWIFYSFKIVKE